MEAPSLAIKQIKQIAGHVYRTVIMKVKENRPFSITQDVQYCWTENN